MVKESLIMKNDPFTIIFDRGRCVLFSSAPPPRHASPRDDARAAVCGIEP
jgi:hypothetical protein